MAGDRYSNTSTPTTPCWRPLPLEADSKLVLLLLRPKPLLLAVRVVSTRMVTRPVPWMPGPGGTLHRSTVWETISDWDIFCAPTNHTHETNNVHGRGVRSMRGTRCQRIYMYVYICMVANHSFNGLVDQKSTLITA